MVSATGDSAAPAKRSLPQRVLPRALAVRAANVRIRARRRRAHRQLLRALPKGGRGVEVGVWRGDHAVAILRWARPSMLYLIDPWEYRPELPGALYGGQAKDGQSELDEVYRSVLARFRRQIDAGGVSVMRIHSDDFDLPPGSLDWAYIDGDHNYEAVRADLEHFAALVRPGGFIAGDDYRGGSWFKGNITRAVDEFAQTPRCKRLTLFGRKFLIELS